ncbi:F-box-like/WD repeat-containing protein TBL1XR1-A [Astathelohania contejeani]|uniref:F-box-like/WD repeat-containing protein TBL1XR1-A n=1 Tax=Astathelohania contejeani TaxID=164912 RepID=A0ABQ7HZB1_9MICR|nr:F-box-like/WD repeat-containing protein TBL1XR1-A [Thelohania contejeani]
MIIVSTDEINELIKGYLKQEGYYHTLFAFNHEALSSSGGVRYTLKDLVQCGVNYIFVNEHIVNGKFKDCGANFSISGEHVCKRQTKAKRVKKNVNAENTNLEKKDADEKENNKKKINNKKVGSNKPAQEDNGLNDDKLKIEPSKEDITSEVTINDDVKKGENNVDDNISTVVLHTSKGLEYKQTILSEHTEEVSYCLWYNNTLATGGKDATVRIYESGKMKNSKSIKKEITALSWSEDGVLSVGNYDGNIYNISNDMSTMNDEPFNFHLGPIFALKHRGERLLSGAFDGKLGITQKGENPIIINVHKSTIFDVEWITDDLACTCSTDCTIGMVNLINKEISYLRGHTSDIYTIIKQEDVLASCSEDKNIRIWDLKNKSSSVLSGHASGVYDIAWMDESQLVSAGADGAVKLWDVGNQICSQTYYHEKRVYALDYNKNLNLIITGSLDKSVKFWDKRIGEVGVYRVNGHVSNLNSSKDGNLLCICSSDQPPVVLELRYMKK